VIRPPDGVWRTGWDVLVVRALREGDPIAPFEPVLQIEGDYALFAQRQDELAAILDIFVLRLFVPDGYRINDLALSIGVDVKPSLCKFCATTTAFLIHGQDAVGLVVNKSKVPNLFQLQIRLIQASNYDFQVV